MVMILNLYFTKMDVNLFLKTYVNVMVGMWDDYWNNSNNFYFYFDGAGKFYFILMIMTILWERLL